MSTGPASPAARPIQLKEIEQRLQARLQPTRLEVIDESASHAGHAGANAQGFGSHFRVRIASPAFAGKSRVACHRLVYDAMQNFIDQGLHALAIEIVDSSLPP
ncbi:MAG: transcriptional regulator, BolA protein family [Polaromonas sp.]|nr:transcriptional regulator, BolA protein family [Polaromonas sp.]